MRILRSAAISIASFATLLAAACGGDPGTTATPPPPPPAPGAPASITVQAGDGQSAAVSAAVPIRPVVIVKDAAGLPVPGVVVTFSIDSGGGTVAGGTATTGTDGLATISGWTLGPVPGTNVLRVSVSGVAPRLITATATAIAVAIATNYPIASGGGSFTYSKPGDVLNGLVLTVPAAAFGHATQWSITSQPGAPASLPADAFLVAPMLSITNNEVYADSLIRLRIPVRAGIDTAVGAFFYDPAQGTLELAPILGREAGAVTIVARHFSADQLLTRATSFPATIRSGALGGSSAAKPAGASLFTSSIFGALHSASATGSVNIVIVGAKRSGLVVKQLATSFVPAADTWEFTNQLEWIYFRGMSSGMAITEVDYNVRYKSAAGSLLDKFYRGPGGISFWGDSPIGIRMSAITEQAVDAVINKLYLPAAGSFPGTFLTTKDTQVFDAITLALYLTGKPQVIAAQGSNLFHSFIVYGALPGQLLVSNPNVLRSAATLPFDGTNFSVVTVAQFVGAAQQQVAGYTVLGLSSLIAPATLSANWAAAVAGTVGNADYPSMPLEYYNYTSQAWQPVPAGDTLRIASDTFLVRNNCSNCVRNRVGSPLATRQFLDIYAPDSVPVANDRPDFVRGALVRMNPSVRTLALLSSALTQDPADGFRYTDTRWLTVVSTVATIGPRDATGPVDSLYTFFVRPPAAVPSGTSYKWTITLPPNAPFVATTTDTTYAIRLADIGVYSVKVDVVNSNLGTLGSDSTTTTTKSLQVAMDQSPILRAYPGDVKTLSATVTGFLPASVRYDWVFGDQGTTRVPTTVPTTTHSWATNGSYTASVALRDPVANTLLGGSFTNVQIKNWAGAWLITSFIRTGETLTDQLTIPRDAQAWIQMRDTLTRIESGQVPALVFLDDPVLWPEQAVYFEIFPPGNTFLDLYYWQPGGLVTQLARTSAIQFSNYTQTGNTKSGTLNGVGYVTTLNGSFFNSISAVKSQNQLTGTMTIGLYSINGPHGSRTYQFTATRVSP